MTGARHCYRCKSVDHIVRDCPIVQESRCYQCKEEGHTSKHCPNQTVKPSSSVASASGGKRKSALTPTPPGEVFSMTKQGADASSDVVSGRDMTRVRHCYRCRSVDHIAQDCPKDVQAFICFHCKEEGHIAKYCPNQTPNQTVKPSSSVASPSEGKRKSALTPTTPSKVFLMTKQGADASSDVVSEKMEMQAPFASPNIDPYALAQVHQIAMQRMQQNGGMNNFSGRTYSFGAEQEHANFPLKAEGQRQWDKSAPKAPDPLISQPYSEDQDVNATQSLYGGHMPDPQLDFEKKKKKEPRTQAYEQDMEIGYEDKPSVPSLEGLEQRFLDEIMILAKEQRDAEDAENARHRERIIEINAQYQEKLSSLRAQQAKRREEFLFKESQTRLHQYKQAASDHYPIHGSSIDSRGYVPINVSPIDPHGYSQIDPRGYVPANDPRGYLGVAAAETHPAYAAGQFESSKESVPFVGGGRNQVAEGRVPIPQGRVYNNR